MAQSFTLSNGLTVVFEERHAARVVACQVWVRAGSADERPDQAGMAHLHEHMLFKGTARRKSGEIAREIEAHGGQINAWTSYDQTVFHVEIASRFARVGLDILADAMRRSSFEPEELAREIEVVCEEIKRNQDAPSRRASRDLFFTAYQEHPYRLPVSGTAESVRSFNREKILAFYERHYAPPNMVLCVAGDFREAELRAWVEELFDGDWGRPYPGPVQRPTEPVPTGRRLLLRTDNVKGAWLSLGFHIPDISHPDTPVLDLLAMMIGMGEGSRLVREVKRRRGLVNTVQAASYTPRDPGLFSVSLTMQPEKMAEALEAEVGVLARLYAEPVSIEELDNLKALFESRMVYQSETVQGLARRLGYYPCLQGDLEAEDRYRDAVARVTPERLRGVAERYLRFDRAVVTALMPASRSFSEAQVEQILDRAACEAPPLAPLGPLPPASLGRPLRVAPVSLAAPGAVIEERLPSGVRLLVREEHTVPLVAHGVLVQGGLRYETAESNGLCALLARGLTRGTPTHDTDAIARLVERFAGSLRGVSGRNTLGLRGVAHARHFPEAFRLFADCLLHPLFPESEVARERRMLAQEIHVREDKPSAMVFDLFARTLYQRHPYRMSQLGEKASVERLTPEMLRAFHASYLVPSRMVLCVVGDVKVDEVLALAHELFGHAPGDAAPPPEVAPEPPPEAPRYQKRTHPSAQAHLMLGFQGARVGDPSRHALSVLSALLGGQGGRLFRELRDKRGLAYSVSSINLEGVDPGYFGVYMGTSAEKVDAALEAIRAELARVKEESLPEQELVRARRLLIGIHEISLQRNAAQVDMLAMDACNGMGLENFQRYAERISAVTSEDVREVAQRVIDFDRSALAVVGP